MIRNEIEGQISQVIKRVVYRITHDSPAHVTFHMWVNGGRISDSDGMVLRKGEFDEFMMLLGAMSEEEATERGLI